MEYVGELISTQELLTRLHQNVKEDHLYVMQLETDVYLDARRKGNLTQVNEYIMVTYLITQVQSLGLLIILASQTVSLKSGKSMDD